MDLRRVENQVESIRDSRVSPGSHRCPNLLVERLASCARHRQQSNSRMSESCSRLAESSSTVSARILSENSGCRNRGEAQREGSRSLALWGLTWAGWRGSTRYCRGLELARVCAAGALTAVL